MAYEFKKLSDVEVVEAPTDNANVLIEEDGVIKKAPKTAVGGNGEWDAIIDCGEGMPNGYTDESLFVFEKGDYNAIKAKWDEGEMPKIMLKYFDEYGDVWHHRASSQRVVYASDTSFLLHFVLGDYDNTSRYTVMLSLDSNNLFSVGCTDLY